MKRIITFIFLASTLTFFSCEDDVCATGTVRFTCTSSNPYNLFIDGVFRQVVKGGTFVEFQLSSGVHNFRVEQISGYILFPTIIEENFTVSRCGDHEWIFP